MFVSLIIGLMLVGAGEKTVIDGEQFKTVVTAYVEKYLQSNYANVIVEYRAVPKPMTLPHDEYTVEVSPAFGIPQKGFAGIPVEVRRNGKLVKTVVCSVLIRTFDDVYFSARAIDRNEMITPLIFVKKNIETTQLDDDIITEMNYGSRMRTKRMINANSVMKKSMIEDIPCVLRNDVITLVVVSNFVSVETKGVARDDGKIGDEIKVQKNGSKELLTGKVIGKQRVEIVTP